MQLTMYEINAFASKAFSGNPAAVFVLEHFLEDEMMQSIAAQNNLSETVFVVHQHENQYAIRWFAPEAEVNLCGHGTLAASHILFNELKISSTDTLNFESKGGALVAKCKESNNIELDFPARPFKPVNHIPKEIINAISVTPKEVLSSDDYIVVLNSEDEIIQLEADMNQLALLDHRGVIFTAKGKNTDFVSRVFHPKLGIGEDPVCGSAHCELMPYWSDVLNKKTLHAIQLSKRRGELTCTLLDNRVLLEGQCVTYLKGSVFL